MASNCLCQADVWVNAQQVGGSGVGFDEFLSCFCPGADLNLVRGGGDVDDAADAAQTQYRRVLRAVGVSHASVLVAGVINGEMVDLGKLRAALTTLARVIERL